MGLGRGSKDGGKNQALQGALHQKSTLPLTFNSGTVLLVQGPARRWAIFEIPEDAIPYALEAPEDPRPVDPNNPLGHDVVLGLGVFVFADWDDDRDGVVSCEEVLAHGTAYSYTELTEEHQGRVGCKDRD